MFVALGTAVASGVLALAIIAHRGDKPLGDPVSNQATLIVFERDKCLRCDKFRDVMTRPYQQSAIAGKVPMRYFDVTDGPPPARYLLKSEVPGTPTTVAFDIFNREIGRVNGMPESVDDLIALAETAARRADRDNERYNKTKN